MTYLISSIILVLILYFNIFDLQFKCKQYFVKLYFNYNHYILFNKPTYLIPSNNDLLNLINNQIELPKLDNYDTIPNNLFQIYMFYKTPIPQYILDSINTFASSYKHVIFNEHDATQFLTQYFDKCIIQRFNNLKVVAHKADLLRYCYLYIYGGIYIDINKILNKPLDDILLNKTYFYTSFSVISNTLGNGFLASKPRNILFLKLIWYIVNIPLYKVNMPFRLFYFAFCQDIYLTIQNDLINNSKLQPGLNLGKSQNYYLFYEQISFDYNSDCIQFTKGGFCSNYYDKNKKILYRDSNL